VIRLAAAKYRLVLGVALGLAGSAGVLSLYDGGPPQAAPAGPLLSECDGTLREVVMHYTEDSAAVVAPTYQTFLRQLPREVAVHVVCPSRQAFDDLVARVGTVECGLSPVVVGHPITAWSRDRWLALGSPGERNVSLLRPRAEDGAEIWSAREGDERVADQLTAALPPGVCARQSGLYFDGGDFSADSQTAFIRPAVLLRNLQRTVASRDELIRRLSAILKRRVVLFDDAPDHHVAMYLMPVGDRTVLVGDPKMAERLLAESDRPSREALNDYLPGGPDFRDATVAHFEAAARQCRDAGYRVVRIPVVPGHDGRTFITYVNVILDIRSGQRIVYMPVFGCAAALNRAANSVWTELGYEVRPVDCDACGRNFGTLHCLVNVLRRD
jgi:hypothetical protein